MFSVYLPAVEEKSLAVPAQSEAEVPSGVETVMIVDDEPQIRTSMERLLRMSGYQILLASDGLEALEIYQRHKEEIGLVILDAENVGPGSLGGISAFGSGGESLGLLGLYTGCGGFLRSGDGCCR